MIHTNDLNCPNNAASQIWVLAFLLSTISAEVDVGVIVQTADGPIKGKVMMTAVDKEVMAFYSIPYAESPVGPLRFKRPKPVRPWVDILDATQLPYSCVQRGTSFFSLIESLKDWIPTTPMNEDCLKLNVFVPNWVNTNETLPVFVFIHGGGFSQGSSMAKSNDGATFAAQENVVVITMNYRLSSLGFMYLNHSETVANVGLHDQALALKWVNRNARYFGGDPERVTLGGQSSGAVSVGFHLMNPKVNRLFKRAFFMSGSAATPWGLTTKEHALKLSLTTASYSGCQGNVSSIIKCLRKLDASELVANEPLKEYAQVINFQPVIDGEMVIESPLEWFKKNQIPEAMEIITGSMKQEGTVMMASLMPFYFPFQKTSKPTVTLEDIPSIVDKVFPGKSDLEKQIIRFVYESSMLKDDLNSIVQGVNYIFGDAAFTCPVYQLVDVVSSTKNPLYTYMVNHRSRKNQLPDWVGSHHGHDLIYLFGLTLQKGLGYPEEEQTLSKNFMRYFGNFMRTGDPNKNPSNNESTDGRVTWPLYSVDHPEVFVLAPNLTSISPPPRQRYCQFWNRIFPDFAKNLREIKFIS